MRTYSDAVGLLWATPTVGRHIGLTDDGFTAVVEVAFGRPAGSQDHEYTVFSPDGLKLGSGLIGSPNTARDACARLIEEGRGNR